MYKTLNIIYFSQLTTKISTGLNHKQLSYYIIFYVLVFVTKELCFSI